MQLKINMATIVGAVAGLYFYFHSKDVELAKVCGLLAIIAMIQISIEW